MKDDIKIEPCPWCEKKAVTYLEGTYSSGWTSFVQCSDTLHCCARGPTRQTPGCSNNEWVIETEAINAWNSVAQKESLRIFSVEEALLKVADIVANTSIQASKTTDLKKKNPGE